LANVIEVIRLTHLQTIEAGRSIEKSRQKVAAVRDQMGIHLASLAHDVRTPLSSLKLGVSRLHSREIDRALASDLRVELEYLDVVFSNVLALYELELSDRKSLSRDIDVRHFIDGCSERFVQLARDQSVVLVVSDEEDPLMVNCSPSALEQAVTNLVYSAVVHAHENVAISGYVDGQDIVIKVQDDGPIANRSALPNLSDRSFRAELENGRATPDWGLGLAISEAIIRTHGGSLKASVDGDGLLSVVIRLERIVNPGGEVSTTAETHALGALYIDRPNLDLESEECVD